MVEAKAVDGGADVLSESRVIDGSLLRFGTKSALIVDMLSCHL